MSDLLVIRVNCSKKQSIVFLTVLYRFYLFLCPRANHSGHSLISSFFLKSDGSDSLSLLLIKRAIVINFLLSLLTKELWERLALLLTKKTYSLNEIYHPRPLYLYLLYEFIPQVQYSIVQCKSFVHHHSEENVYGTTCFLICSTCVLQLFVKAFLLKYENCSVLYSSV